MDYAALLGMNGGNQQAAGIMQSALAPNVGAQLLGGQQGTNIPHGAFDTTGHQSVPQLLAAARAQAPQAPVAAPIPQQAAVPQQAAGPQGAPSQSAAEAQNAQMWQAYQAFQQDPWSYYKQFQGADGNVNLPAGTQQPLRPTGPSPQEVAQQQTYDAYQKDPWAYYAPYQGAAGNVTLPAGVPLIPQQPNTPLPPAAMAADVQPIAPPAANPFASQEASPWGFMYPQGQWNMGPGGGNNDG